MNCSNKLVVCPEEISTYSIKEWITIKRHPYSFSSYYPSNPKTLGEQLRKKRLDSELIAKQLADKLNVHHRTILNWEMGKVKPKGKCLKKVMDFLT